MIPGFLPLLQDSGSYGSGQNAGRRVGQHWTVAATKVDKMPVGFADVMVSSLKAGIRAGSGWAAQSPSSWSAGGLGAVGDRAA